MTESTDKTSFNPVVLAEAAVPYDLIVQLEDDGFDIPKLPLQISIAKRTPVYRLDQGNRAVLGPRIGLFEGITVFVS